jgi:hypothetical protein
VLFTVCLAIDLKIIVSKDEIAVSADEAVRVEFLLCVRLNVLSLDSSIAACAKRVVDFVVVAMTIWKVVVDVEIRGLERLLAGCTDEAISVIAAGETTIGRTDRLALDEFTTSATVSLVGRTAIWRLKRFMTRWVAKQVFGLR